MNWGRQMGIPSNFIAIDDGDVAGSGAELNAKCMGILSPEAGTLNVTMANGEEVDALPILAGINLGNFAEIRTTASGAPTGMFQIIMEGKRVG
jgi:hypothetical protein